MKSELAPKRKRRAKVSKIPETLLLSESPDIAESNLGFSPDMHRPSLLLGEKVVTANQAKTFESKLLETSPAHELMVLAARAIVTQIMKVLDPPSRITVLCGPGNNGGDAALAAAGLHAIGYKITVVRGFDQNLTRNRPQPKDAQFAWEQLNKLESIAVFSAGEFLRTFHARQESEDALIVDGLLGIGQTRSPTGEIASLIEWANQQKAYKLSIDIPTGLEPTQGIAWPICFQSDLTITFLAHKSGLLMNDGPQYAGQIECVPLVAATPDPWEANALLSSTKWGRGIQEFQRKPNAHKGTSGGVAIIGSSDGMVGAGILSARMALRSGAGRVWLGRLMNVHDQGHSIGEVDWLYPELMLSSTTEVVSTHFDKVDAWIVGPGLGQTDAAKAVLGQILGAAKVPVVLDADALNLLSKNIDLQKLLSDSGLQGFRVITPHVAEAARLLKASIRSVQEDRLGSAKKLAIQFNCLVVLKGNGTVIAGPDGVLTIVAIAAPALATAGTGDVLAGLIGSLLAQQNCSIPMQTRVLFGTWIHAVVGASSRAPRGYRASDLIEDVYHRLNESFNERVRI